MGAYRKMKKRSLGNTGILVSEIGFGTWGLGGGHNGAVAYGAADEKVSLEALAEAIHQDINFFDTSDLYGWGKSEELLGRVSCRREDMVIASKTGFIDKDGTQNFSKKHITESLKKSLSRLNTGYVDIYQLHSPSVEELIENPEPVETLYELKKSGLIRAAGISTRSPQDALPFIEKFPSVDCYQVNFNLADYRALDSGLFELCMKKNIGLVARTPFAFGFLACCGNEVQKFGEFDHRANLDSRRIELWKKMGESFRKLMGSEDPNISPAQNALRFVLSFKAVSTVIPGMLTSEQVIENSKASELGCIAAEKLREIEKSYKQIFEVAN